MSRTTRREILRNIAASVTLGGMSVEAAQHVHQHTAEVKKKTGVYKPRLLNAHEYATVRRLTELIIPADNVSGSAVDAGAPEFIDLIASASEELGAQITGGVAWLDRFSEKQHSNSFVDAAPAEQTAMLDVIAFRKNATPETSQGIAFFDWMRRLTADAFYTSPVGIKDIGFKGNKGMTTFVIPTAAIDYATKRSGLA